MDATVAATLRAPFPAEQLGKLPRITCKACSDAQGRVCNEHNKSKCAVCGNWITERHIDLDYVGHADVTSRLIEADPTWTWEPLASDENGLPLCDTDEKDRPVGLWIKLTVADVTRLGYGSCPANQSDAVKVLIGDALRNAAMRFGVAVDLWAKGDRADPTAENATSAPGQAQRKARSNGKANGKTEDLTPLSAARIEMLQVAKEAGVEGMATVGQHFESFCGKKVQDADLDDIKKFVTRLREDIAARTSQTAGAAS